jgi:formylglycine-generating enzyme required for sulfatase activity
MKYILLAALILFSNPLLFADECLKDFGGGLCLVKVNDDYGIKKKKEFIIPAFFDTVTMVGPNYFQVDQNGRKGIFDRNGKMLVPVSYVGVNTIDNQLGIFEVLAQGLRVVYLTDNMRLLPGFTAQNGTYFVGNEEVSIADYIAMMEHASGNEDEFGFKMTDMIPDTNLLPLAARLPFRYYLSQTKQTGKGELKYEWDLASANVSFPMGEGFEFHVMAQEALQLPVTAISFQQAQMYCKSKSHFYTHKIAAFKKQKLGVRFRLPRIDEWEDFAFYGLPDAMKRQGLPDSIDAKGCHTFHYNNLYDCNYSLVKKEKQAKSVSTGEPSLLGLKNVFGNVAEMIAEFGYCKGGSFAQTAYQSKYQNHLAYSGPSHWLGFRTIAEIYVTE